jgi:integrase
MSKRLFRNDARKPMPTIKLQGTDFIYERISADGRLTSYQVKIRRKRFPRHDTSFDDLEEAKRFVRKVLGDQDRGHKIDRLISHRTSVGNVIEEAIKAIDSGRRMTKGSRDERYRLAKFKKDFPGLCATALADATEDMFEDWMAERLEVVKPNTVLREFRLLKPLFTAAARKYDLLRSPMEYLKPPRSIDERVRRLLPEEEALLFAELLQAQDPIVPLAAQFALEAGCRRSEQLRVEWADYDAVGGTIWLADAKNGRGRYLLLTEAAQAIVEALPGRAEGGKIFKTTGNMLKKAFEYARERAARRAEGMGRPDLVSVATLRWHDFRHEAISRCFDAGWTSEQVMDFSGHVDIKSLLRYRHPKVDESVARLRAMAQSRGATALVMPQPGTLDGKIVGDRARVD